MKSSSSGRFNPQGRLQQCFPTTVGNFTVQIPIQYYHILCPPGFGMYLKGCTESVCTVLVISGTYISGLVDIVYMSEELCIMYQEYNALAILRILLYACILSISFTLLNIDDIIQLKSGMV